VFFSSEVRLSSDLKNFFVNLLKLAKEVSLVAESGKLFQRDEAMKENLRLPALILALGIDSLLFAVALVEYWCTGLNSSLVKHGGLKLFRILNVCIRIR
jgi:hypothetical protein